MGNPASKKTDNNNNPKDFTKIVESVIFAPHTPNSTLMKDLQSAEDTFCRLNNSPKYKFVERGRPKLKDILSNYIPWDMEYCKWTECWLCSTKKEGKYTCRIEFCTYRIMCSSCEEEGCSANYFGETSCSLFCRRHEHKEALDKKSEDSALWEHQVKHHDTIDAQFRVEIVGRHLTAFNRQVSEGVLISNDPCTYPMNRKYEYNGSRMPRLLTVVNGHIVIQKRTYADQVRSEKPPKKQKVEDNINEIKDVIKEATEVPKDDEDFENGAERTELDPVKAPTKEEPIKAPVNKAKRTILDYMERANGWPSSEHLVAKNLPTHTKTLVPGPPKTPVGAKLEPKKTPK